MASHDPGLTEEAKRILTRPLGGWAKREWEQFLNSLRGLVLEDDVVYLKGALRRF